MRANIYRGVMFPLLLVLYATGLCVVQAKLQLVFEDADCLFANSEYIVEDTCSVEAGDDDENDSCINAYLDIIESFDEDTEGIGYIKKFHMGSYSLDMGLKIEGEICELLNRDDMVAAPILGSIGITADNCPPEPGVYETSCYYPDNMSLPEDFLNGRYAINFTLFKDDTIYLNACLYLAVE